MSEDIKEEVQNPQSQKDHELAHKIYEEFGNGTSFVQALQLDKHIARSINFEEGRQWNMDEDVEDFPKITLNIIKQIGKVKKSHILQNEYGFLVNTTKTSDIRKIQDFLKFLHDKLRLKKKDLKVINDTYKKGTGIIYFYWDAESQDFLANSGGKLRSEVIDIRRFRVADPYTPEIQDQPWVMYVTRETKEAIEHKYGIEPTADDVDHNVETELRQNSDDPKDEMVNVYTKFYRNADGQVHFIISTMHEILKHATPLNPFYDIKEEGADDEEMPSTMSTMDEKRPDKLRELKQEVFNLYPFASLVIDERDNNFYGIPGAYEYIEAQKSINNHFSVYDKGVQDNVLGGFIMKRGSIGDQEITTENGQIIQLDLKPGESIQDVFGRIPVNNIPNETLNYSANLMGVVRQTSGASNVQIGQADHAGQSGKQTEMLLQRAKENSSDVALLFNEFKKDQAMIMFLFSKFFYDNESFSITDHGFKKDNVREYTGKQKFDGNQYLGKDVLIDVKVGPAPSFSEYASIELLGMMVQSGQAPIEVYIANLPDGYVNNKEELLEMTKNNSQKVIEKLTNQLEQSKQVMEQMSKAHEQVQKDLGNIDTVINENQRLKSQMAELAARGIEIQRDAAQRNSKMTQEMQDLLDVVKRGGAQSQQRGSQPTQQAQPDVNPRQGGSNNNNA